MISIITPVYNHARYLPEYWSSLQAQGPGWEAILVDDGSTDDSYAVAAEHCSRLLRQEHRGPAAARNLALEAAQGEIILPLDADDTLPPGTLDLYGRILAEHKDIDVVYGHVFEFGAWERPCFLRPYDFDLHHIQNLMPVSCAMRRGVYEAVKARNGVGFDPDIPGFEDWLFWLTVAHLGFRFGQVNAFTLNYRRKPGSKVERDRARLDTIMPILARKLRELFPNCRACRWNYRSLEPFDAPPVHIAAARGERPDHPLRASGADGPCSQGARG